MTASMTASCQIFEADRLDCRLVEHRLDLAETEERRVEELWRENRSRNPSLYDGRILLARRAEALVDESRALGVREVELRGKAEFLETRLRDLLLREEAKDRVARRKTKGS